MSFGRISVEIQIEVWRNTNDEMWNAQARTFEDGKWQAGEICYSRFRGWAIAHCLKDLAVRFTVMKVFHGE